jgi:tetratricopeptide (TPR) repeat protein
MAAPWGGWHKLTRLPRPAPGRLPIGCRLTICPTERPRTSRFLTGLLLLGALFSGCGRQAADNRVERIAILRFENLGAGVADDWMGRAFAEVITAELAGAPGIYAIPSSRLHGSDRVLGPRPVAAPGISAERSLALASGATSVGYGEYFIRGGRLSARLTVEDLRSGQMPRVVSAGAGDVLAVASELARRISSRAAPYGTTSVEALKAYVAAGESSSIAATAENLDAAIAADPNFGPPYRLLAQLKAQQQDRAAAEAVLGQALARAGAMPQVERALLQMEAANLRGDSATRVTALTTLAALQPNDPAIWSSLAESYMKRRQYRQAVVAFGKLLEVEPEEVNALNQLGYAAAYAGTPDTGLNALRRYQALRPTEANPLDSQGDVSLLAGRLREAETFYLQAAKLDPNFESGGDLWKAAMARLMSGDVAGADKLAQQYIEAREAAKDPVTECRKAEWSWVSGRRKSAWESLNTFARGAENGPLREFASRSYSQLAIWSLVLGDRAAAGELAQKGAQLAGPSSASAATLARFLAQPPASASEWSVRAERLIPSAAGNSFKSLALAYALLLDKQFQPASLLLKQLDDGANLPADPSLPVMLAWTCLEAGSAADAAPLLRLNPIPSSNGLSLFAPFYFPRIYYLRGLLAEKEGKPGEARANYQLFRQLSGPDPLIWGEEQRASRAQ